MDWINSIYYHGDNQTISVLKQTDNYGNSDFNMEKNNGFFKKNKYLKLFTIIFLLSFSIVFSQKNITEISPIGSLTTEKLIATKIQEFEKMTEADKQKEIYKECLETHQSVSKPTISTGGTEYLQNDNARIFARILDGNANPINLASCNATIYYPNNTKFLNNQQLTFLENGIYYYDFITPNITGNYITTFDCIFPAQIFTQNISLGGQTVGLNTPYIVEIQFDNSNNVTINYANVSLSTRNGKYNLYYDGYVIIANGGATGGINIVNSTILYYLLPSKEQLFTVDCIQGCPLNLDWFSLVVNFTYNYPFTTIRGQNEVHVTNITDYIYFINQFNQTWINQQYIVNNITNSTNYLDNEIYNAEQNVLDSIDNSTSYLDNKLILLNQSLYDTVQNILTDIDNTKTNITLQINQVKTDMSIYYSNLDMKLDNVTSTIINSKIEILNSISSARSDIEIIKEWLSYMFGEISGTTKDTGQSWIDKIVGRHVTLPDWIIPRPQ